MALLPLVSCDKEGGVVGQSDNRSMLVFQLSRFGTRSAVTEHESDVRSLDLLVFRAADGGLDSHTRAVSDGNEDLSAVSARVLVGVPMHWYVVANAPDGKFADIATESAFLSLRTTLSESVAFAPVMYSSGNVIVSPSGSSVTARLDRYMCKVSVQSVKVDYMDSFSTAPEVVLNRLVLVNVVGDIPMSGIPSNVTGSWYNRMTVDGNLPSDIAAVLVSSFAPVTVSSSDAVSLSSPLYAMPNPTSNSVNSAIEPDWSVRNTRVSLELLINGVSNWYSVDLPGMLPNRHYVINSLTISGPGSESPDLPVSRSEVMFTVNVQEWGVNELGLEFPNS